MTRSRRRVAPGFVLVLLLALAPTTALGAQYGGVSGLFVSIDPDRPGFADFTGLGCTGGDTVALYLPGIQATTSDPASRYDLPGRVLAVTTADASSDPLIDGTFAFPGVPIPPELEPGVYAFHTRCGDLDMRVHLEISAGGSISTSTGTDDDVMNPIEDIPGALPFTGGAPSRLLAFAAALLAAGVGFVAVGRRNRPRTT